MTRPGISPARARSMLRAARQGYTLIEMMMATLLTMMMMSGVVVLFESIGKAVTDSRSLLEMNDRLRAAAARLHQDLQGVTVTMAPPRRPEANEGYFQITEGPLGVVNRPAAVYVNSDLAAPNNADSTAADHDDMLMFTFHSDEPILGRYQHPVTGATTIQSSYVEVAYFVRCGALYRRVLLIKPGTPLVAASAGFFANNDISIHLESGIPVPNTLGDLTKPENRFAHRPRHNPPAGANNGFPFHPHFATDWTATPPGLLAAGRPWAKLGLPTMCECSAAAWLAGDLLPNVALTPSPPLDLWKNPICWQELDRYTGSLTICSGLRVSEDVLLTNVLGFDVKVWDPGAPIVMDDTGKVALLPQDPGYLAALAKGNSRVSYGAYVDLNYMAALNGASGGNPNYTPAVGAPYPSFHGAGQARSGLRGTEPFDPASPPADLAQRDSVYDTWSLHYENDGIAQFPGIAADTGNDGLDNNGDGIVDDPGEAETSAPYPVPLRGVQIRIRVFEPSSRQVREVTVVQDFLPK